MFSCEELTTIVQLAAENSKPSLAIKAGETLLRFAEKREFNDADKRPEQLCKLLATAGHSLAALNAKLLAEESSDQTLRSGISKLVSEMIEEILRTPVPELVQTLKPPTPLGEEIGKRYLRGPSHSFEVLSGLLEYPGIEDSVLIKMVPLASTVEECFYLLEKVTLFSAPEPRYEIHDSNRPYMEAILNRFYELSPSGDEAETYLRRTA